MSSITVKQKLGVVALPYTLMFMLLLLVLMFVLMLVLSLVLLYLIQQQIVGDFDKCIYIDKHPGP